MTIQLSIINFTVTTIRLNNACNVNSTKGITTLHAQIYIYIRECMYISFGTSTINMKDKISSHIEHCQHHKT